MGIKLFSSSSVNDFNITQDTNTSPNPNPSNWKILKHFKEGEYLIIKINYPNCTNHEGNKILVYKGVSLEKLKDQVRIDPHFSEDKNYHFPIARFEPTQYGWDLAKKLVECLK